MKDIKIIFFDIDGTLIAMDQDTISEKTLEALKRLQEKGVKLCLATGRGPIPSGGSAPCAPSRGPSHGGGPRGGSRS